MIYDGAIQLFTWLQKGGFAAIFAFILFGGYRKWWVFGWHYKEVVDRLEKVEESNIKWMEIALRGTKVAENIAESKANV